MSLGESENALDSVIQTNGSRSAGDSEKRRNGRDPTANSVSMLDRHGRLLFMNQDGLCNMEIDDFNDVRGKPWASLWPAESQPLVTSSIALALHGHVGHFTANCPTVKGSPKWWDVTVTLVPEMDGAPARLLSVSYDITDQLAAEKKMRTSNTALRDLNDEMTIATGEMAHRINNTLAVVQSIITQTARTTPEPRAFARAVEGRIAAMASANRSLANGDWEGASLESMIRKELGAYISEDTPRLKASGPAIGLPSSAVVAFALVVHELATNAVKYGALSGDDGEVLLSWTVEDDGEKKMLLLQWREQGGPPVTLPTRKGFGSMLLDRGIDGCKVVRRFEPDGLSCSITLPL